MSLPPYTPRRNMQNRHIILALSLVATACATPLEVVDDVPVAHEPDAISLEGWASETITLPPGFAPELPNGVEELRFAPGWRDPSSDGFWSYAIVMWIDEPAPDAARIDELLENYYDGLISAVAGDGDKSVGSDPAQVDVRRTAPNHFEAQIHLIDTFTTFEPMDLRVMVDTVTEAEGHSALHIQASPQPEEHAIWRSLEAAIAAIQES